MTAAPPSAPVLRQQRGLEVLSWPAADALDADVLMTTRHGGVSAGPYATLNLGLHVGDETAAVLENRRRVAAALGAAPGDFVFGEQTHGREVAVVSAADRGRGTQRLDDTIRGVDALVTSDPGTVLAVLAADCVPIVLYDPVAHVLAGVHAGWRGTLARIASAAAGVMCSLGAQPGSMLAWLGPAIAADRYQVGPEVAAAAEQGLGGERGKILRPDGGGRWLLDLPAANRAILRQAGLPDSNIHDARMPTGDGVFFSDRDARPCGRFAAVARLRPRAAR